MGGKEKKILKKNDYRDVVLLKNGLPAWHNPGRDYSRPSFIRRYTNSAITYASHKVVDNDHCLEEKMTREM